MIFVGPFVISSLLFVNSGPVGTCVKPILLSGTISCHHQIAKRICTITEQRDHRKRMFWQSNDEPLEDFKMVLGKTLCPEIRFSTPTFHFVGRTFEKEIDFLLTRKMLDERFKKEEALYLSVVHPQNLHLE